jgi:PAS domain S-box-containing protein
MLKQSTKMMQWFEIWLTGLIVIQLFSIFFMNILQNQALMNFMFILIVFLQCIALGMFHFYRKQYRNENQELQNKYKRLSLTIDAGEIGFWDWNMSTNDVYYSPGYFSMLGYEPDEFPMTFDTWENLMHPEDREIVVPQVVDYIKNAKTYEIEFRLKCKDSSWLWISGRGKSYDLDQNGNPTRAFGVHVNIDELKHVQNKYKRMAFITEQAIEGIAVSNFDGYIQYANPAWCLIHGYQSLNEILGQHLGIFHSEEQFEKEVIPFNNEVMKHGRYIGEVGHMRKDGSTFPTMMGTVKLMDEKGIPYGFAGFAQDITEQKQKDKILFRALKETEIASKAKSEFLTHMSHEIRTPLNGIIGIVDLLIETPLTDEQQNYVNIMLKSGNTLLNLVNNIFNYSKIESGKYELGNVNFNLQKFLKDLVQLMAHKAEEKQLKMSYVIDTEVPWALHGDFNKLRQILMNLIENAIKFTEQGKIFIRVTLDHEYTSYLKIRFTVKDTGIGIPQEIQQKLFSPFTQGDLSITKKYEGAGLGLAIARQLAELMGGDIGVDSEPDRGSSFWFTANLQKQDDENST